MDPVAQVLAQQQSGSASGEGFGQFFVQGRQLRNQRDQLNLANRRLDLEQHQEQRAQTQQDMLLPIQQKLLSAQAINAGAAAVLTEQQALAATALNSALPELVNLQMEFMNAPDGFANRELIAKAQALSQKYPKAFVKGAPGNDLMLQVMAVPMLKQQWKQTEDRIRQLERVTPADTYLHSFDPRTGEFQFAPKPKTAVPDKIEVAQYRSKLADTAANDPDPAKRAAAKSELESLDMQMANSTTEVFDPATGNPIMRTTTGKQTQAGGGLTTSVLAKVQEKSLAADSAISRLDDALSSIEGNRDAMGVRGKLGEFKESAIGQVFPNAEVDTSTTETREKAALAFTEIAKGLRVDTGNMSRYELNQLERLGDLNSVANSAQQALKKGKILRNTLIGQKLRLLKAEQKVPDERLLLKIDPTQLPALVNDGLLTPETALRLYDLRNPK